MLESRDGRCREIPPPPSRVFAPSAAGCSDQVKSSGINKQAGLSRCCALPGAMALPPCLQTARARLCEWAVVPVANEKQTVVAIFAEGVIEVRRPSPYLLLLAVLVHLLLFSSSACCCPSVCVSLSFLSPLSPSLSPHIDGFSRPFYTLRTVLNLIYRSQTQISPLLLSCHSFQFVLLKVF